MRNSTKTKLLVILTAFLSITACSQQQPESKSKTASDESTAQTTPKKDSPGLTAKSLRANAFRGNLQKVKNAVKQGINIDAQDQAKRTPLMLAAYNGHTKVVRYLLAHGATVSLRDKNGRTPLIFAASGPFPETVTLLLKNGAKVNKKDNGEGWTALMFAAAGGHFNTVQKLLDAGANATITDKDGDKALDFAQDKGHTKVVKLLKNRN